MNACAHVGAVDEHLAVVLERQVAELDGLVKTVHQPMVLASSCGRNEVTSSAERSGPSTATQRTARTILDRPAGACAGFVPGSAAGGLAAAASAFGVSSMTVVDGGGHRLASSARKCRTW